jgi:hypothetical protein
MKGAGKRRQTKPGPREINKTMAGNEPRIEKYRDKVSGEIIRFFRRNNFIRRIIIDENGFFRFGSPPDLRTHQKIS